jgi:hypothetical protein
MRRHIGLLALVCASVASLACGEKVIVVNGIVVYQRPWAHTTSELEPRASFEFQCPREQLSFTLLKRRGRYPTEVGAEGCGRRGVYIRVVTGGMRGHVGPWVLNSERPAPVAPTPVPAPTVQSAR